MRAFSYVFRLSAVIIAIALFPGSTSSLGSRRNQATSKADYFHTPAAVQTPQTIQPLTVGVPVERELIPGNVHFFSVSANAGQFFRVVVMQDGIDVTVRLKAPNGNQIIEVDSPNGRNGPEPASAIAELTGIFTLEVAALDNKAVPGRYQITLQALRLPSATDRDRLFADRTLSEAQRLHAQETKEAVHKALALYKLALPVLRALEDHWTNAEILHATGRAYYLLGEMTNARNYISQALEQWRLNNDRAARRFEAIALSSLAATYTSEGEPEKAAQYREQALALIRKTGDRLNEAYMLRDQGWEYIYLDRNRAFTYLNEALTIAGEMKHRRLEGTLLSYLGIFFTRYGEPREALEYFNQALRVQRTIGDQWAEANSLTAIARVYQDLGELQEALKYFDASLAKQRVVGNRLAESGTLTAMGYAYISLGEPGQALNQLREALTLARTIQDRSAETSALFAFARAHQSLLEYQKALDNLKAVQALNRITGSQSSEGYTLAEIGRIYLAMGKREDAVDSLQQALRLLRIVQDRNGEARCLSELGAIHTSGGRIDEAIKSLQTALSLQRAGGDNWGEANTLYRLAKANSAGRRFEAARGDIEAAVSSIERIRHRLVDEQLRTSLLASKQDYYELYVEILMEMRRHSPSAGYDGLALQTSERSRARGLLEMLRESRVDIRAGVDPALSALERITQQRLNAKANRLVRLLSERHSHDQEAEARKEIDDLVSQYRQVLSEIRAKSPRYAALIQPDHLTVEEIQKELDEDTVLLEYTLGKERSYVFALTPTSIRSYQLPGRAVIEERARDAYELLTKKADALHPEVLRELSQMLLGPVANELANKRLLVVKEGALQYMPFAALPDPTTRSQPLSKRSNEKAGFQPLVTRHEVIDLPSASVLVLQRRVTTRRSNATKKLIVFADPVFDQSDYRVRGSRIRRAKGDGEVEKADSPKSEISDHERSASDVGLGQFQRLPLSRKEAELITKSIQKDRFVEALDFAASHKLATSSELANYQIVHFASHSLLNNRHPELSGVVLSLVNEQGQPENGFLRLNEVYNLKLEADLVVLSACQTALGKDIKGEGLVGLTRGFMYAGTPRVVASLWKVNDAATAELMKQFYQNMLVKGMRPPEALRAAQISLSRQNQWAAPYYWAGFVFQGEWR